MIQINLLPSKKQAKAAKGKDMGAAAAPSFGGGGRDGGGEGSAIGMLLATLAILVTIGSIGYFAYGKYASIRDARVACETKESEVKKLEAILKNLESELKDLKEINLMLTNEIAVLLALDSPNRILWCEKIHQLTQLAPDQIFLTKLQLLDESLIKVADDAKKALDDWSKADATKRGPKPETRMEMYVRQRLRITGVAYAPKSAERGPLTRQYQRLLQTGRFKREDKKSVRMVSDAEIGVTLAAAPTQDADIVSFMSGFAPGIQYNNPRTRPLGQLEVVEFTYDLQTAETPVRYSGFEETITKVGAKK